MLNQLIHHGIVIPEPPPYRGLCIIVRGKEIRLTPKREEMALAWVKKLGTPYAEDSVFIRNFFADFSQALNISPPLKVEEVDFKQVIRVVEAEREARENMTKEERKALVAERKAKREEMKEKYGFAIADGENIELANYLSEPSSIFMGRGKHPLRGRWKEGARQSDITLNLSPDASVPEGDWKEIVWQPEFLWVARWQDKLTGKMKYIWLHDTAPIKQVREAQKFNKALELQDEIDNVREHIQNSLNAEDPKRRKIATACYLIDALCLRVGDEKDPDEADTVGATTLRPEHIKLSKDGTAEFRFLGKDSVLWNKKINLPPDVHRNLEELTQDARPSSNGNKKKHRVYNKPQLFPDVSSRNINAFLSEVLSGLTAKVFRTYHASKVVREALLSADVQRDDPEYKKWQAAVHANTKAAILCNHTKKAPANWSKRRERYKEREKNLKKRMDKIKKTQKEEKQKKVDLRKEAAQKRKAATTRAQRQKIVERYQKKLVAAQHKIERLGVQEERAQIAYGKLKAQMNIAMTNRTWNLGTSQKSYIDPRAFYRWGQKVGYDVLEKYYSKTLRRKFMWIRSENEEDNQGDLE